MRPNGSGMVGLEVKEADLHHALAYLGHKSAVAAGQRRAVGI